MERETDGYRLLFDANPRPMFVSDRETLEILTVNRAACELYEWSREELVGMSLRDIRPPEQLEFFAASYADTTKHATATYSRLGRHRTKTGRVMDVTLEITSVRFEDRAASLVVITDVTGIAEAERRFKLLVENSGDGISLTNANNVVEYVSPGGRRILGYDEGEIVGTHAGLIAHPDDIAAWKPPAPGEAKHNVARMLHRDGSWRWIESTTTNLTHEPAVRAYVSNYRDITERKESEEAVRRSETTFRTLIERAPISTFVHRDGRLVYANPAAIALLGHARADEIVGRQVLDYVHPDDRDDLARRMTTLVEPGTVRHSRIRMVRSDGSQFILEGTALLLDFDGMPSHVVMGHDVTERDAIFARIAMADRMLSVGTLAAGVAHEINNPLAYVATNLELLAAELPNIRPSHKSRLTDAALQCLVTDAREGVARVNAIVRDLRSLSRADEQKRTAVDVASVLASSLKMTNTELRHRARVAQSIAPGLPPVEVDPSRLGQVFINLLLNAAQAIPEGQADRNEIRARASVVDGTVRIDISDTGSGIPPAILGRIFDPFFTTKAPGAGTGLGLAISHQIIRSFGGDIAVESHPGSGSTFTVILPVAVGTTPEIPRDPGPQHSFSRRVLIIDDEAAVGRSLQMLLAPETEVVSVLRADDALDRLARGERFDAIVCDLMMPHSSGMQLYEQLERIAPECRERIIFMTGGAFTPQAREFLEKVGRPHLEKPFSEQELRDAIASVTR